MFCTPKLHIRTQFSVEYVGFVNFLCIFPERSVSCIIFRNKKFAALRLRISCALRVYWRKETQWGKACFLTPNEAAEKTGSLVFFEMERYFLFFICSQTVCLSF